MITTIQKVRELAPELSNVNDELLKSQLDAIEELIRKYTNNNFQNRNIRVLSDIKGGGLASTHPLMLNGDTVQISQSKYNNKLYVIGSDTKLIDESEVLVTKIEYPFDVVFGVANLLKWENRNRDKVGVQSETISRHSVTYFNMDGENSTIGYPKSLVGFLKPYMKARF